MSAAMPSGSPENFDALPPAIVELCLQHDETCEMIQSAVDGIEKELAGNVDRESRRELASAVHDVANQLAGLLDAKLEAGYFEGKDGTSIRCTERLAHLKADYRRLLNELRQADHEIATGKPPKARRQLSHWLSHFSDVCGRETDLIEEVWGAEG